MSVVTIYNGNMLYKGKGSIEECKPAEELELVKSQLIPSPPLSPSVRSTPIGNIGGNKPEAEAEHISKVLSPECSFPLAELKDYSFKINAWEKIHESRYKRNCSSFLNHYYALASSSGKKTTLISKKPALTLKRRARDDYSDYSRRRTRDYSNEYVSEYDRVRTRRSVNKKGFESSSDGRDLENVVITPKKRKIKADSPAKPTFVDWESLPNYCPSLDTLPNNRCLSTEWKGSPMDLSHDPLLNMLHPAEITLASVLRLPCNVYLDSKRRLFAEKVSRLKKNLPFRRTDAQKACRIDVNKASRLFASFEKIGWLDNHHFNKFI